MTKSYLVKNDRGGYFDIGFNSFFILQMSRAGYAPLDATQEGSKETAIYEIDNTGVLFTGLNDSLSQKVTIIGNNEDGNKTKETLEQITGLKLEEAKETLTEKVNKPVFCKECANYKITEVKTYRMGGFFSNKKIYYGEAGNYTRVSCKVKDPNYLSVLGEPIVLIPPIQNEDNNCRYHIPGTPEKATAETRDDDPMGDIDNP